MAEEDNEEMELTDVEGVGETKAESLREAGYEEVDDLREATQDDLSEVDGVGKALAARIKADVGGLEVEEVEEEEVEEEGVEEEEEVEEEAEVRDVVSAASLSDKTPELDDETREALKKRNSASKPDFKRQDYHKKKRVPESWHRPRGSHSRQRKEKKSRGANAGVGHRTQTEVRGLHPSGFEEVLVHRPDDLDDVDPDTEAVRIGGSVGGRKRERIEEKALEEEIRVLNPTHVRQQEAEQ
ncbi:MAG: 50S ribosomal protein L32e [Halobacteria archaeon]|nr:50S ribosomal protein L32e [Halobacteria archaeon]